MTTPSYGTNLPESENLPRAAESEKPVTELITIIKTGKGTRYALFLPTDSNIYRIQI